MADWSITIPLSELADLMGLPGRMEKLESELKQARREIDGLRQLNGQALLKIADLKKRTAQENAWRISPLPSCRFYKEVSTILCLYYDKANFVFLCMETDAKPIDLGHDDVDGQECKDGRSRTWMILIYEDNEVMSRVLNERLKELDWDYAGRIHDQEGKPHHHVVCLFKDGRKAADVAKDLGLETRWLRAWDRKKRALRYLCHRDNPEKFQYDTDGIYGTVAEKAVAACAKSDALSESQAVQEILKIIDEYDAHLTYSVALRLMAEKGCFSVFRRMGVFGTRLIDEHNYFVAERASKRKEHDDMLTRYHESLKS